MKCLHFSDTENLSISPWWNDFISRCYENAAAFLLHAREYRNNEKALQWSRRSDFADIESICDLFACYNDTSGNHDIAALIVRRAWHWLIGPLHITVQASAMDWSSVQWRRSIPLLLNIMHNQAMHGMKRAAVDFVAWQFIFLRRSRHTHDHVNRQNKWLQCPIEMFMNEIAYDDNLMLYRAGSWYRRYDSARPGEEISLCPVATEPQWLMSGGMPSALIEYQFRDNAVQMLVMAALSATTAYCWQARRRLDVHDIDPPEWFFIIK